MLIELRIENLAVIERLSLRPEPGLNVLTGETGAGKSIIVGALSLLLGERASSESVRSGADRAIVEGVFDIADSPEVRALLEERGIDVADDLVILRREVAAGGRSRNWVNGAASTASFVGDVGRHLVDLHGQHEHQSLLRAAEQRAILDAFGGCTELAAQVRSANADVRDAAARLDTLDARRREIGERADLLRFQVEEIERAHLVGNEEEELEAEAFRLEHAEELARLASRLHQELYGAEDAIAGRLGELRRALVRLIQLDASLGDTAKALDEAFYGLEELGRQLGEYAAAVEADPVRLDEIRRRQDLIFRLKGKYGPAVEDVIETGRAAREELAALDESALSRRELEREVDAARSRFARLCEDLSGRRTTAASRLDAEMNAALPELGMPDARFVTSLERLAEPGSSGAEAVELRVSVNAGFEPGPLARIASGGELSRIMLALKAALAREDRVSTLVFDEIDVGIGGRAAHRVAERLHAVAAHRQVFVVTHLAQIASRADSHVLVEKSEHDGRASTAVRVLDGEARIREVARLLGGDPESSISLAHARELIEAGA